MAFFDVDLHTGPDRRWVNTRHAHGGIIHIKLMKRTMPHDDRTLIAHLMNARFFHAAVPELMVTPNKQWLVGSFD